MSPKPKALARPKPENSKPVQALQAKAPILSFLFVKSSVSKQARFARKFWLNQALLGLILKALARLRLKSNWVRSIAS